VKRERERERERKDLFLWGQGVFKSPLMFPAISKVTWEEVGGAWGHARRGECGFY